MFETLLVVTLLYIFLFVWLWRGIRREKFNSQNSTALQETNFSILVSARNEEKSLPKLLDSINALDYPKERFELIVIDDQSSDGTSAAVENFKALFELKLLHQSEKILASKKAAIAKGLAAARFEYIIVTDADCVVQKNWLKAFDGRIADGSNVVAAPVSYFPSSNFFQNLVAIDFMSLISFGAGLIGSKRPIICNGANFCYAKSAFLAVDGFSGIDGIASGDDDLLLQKFANHGERIAYLWSSNALVQTKAPETLRDFLLQRKRWGSKGAHYKNITNRAFMFAMFLFSCSWALALFFLFKSGGELQIVAAATICFKFFAELPVMIEARRLFQPKIFWLLVPIVSFLQIPYVILVGIWASFGSYTWKD